MSRFSDYDGDGDYTITYEMWQWNLMLALGSKRGQLALRELREALLALPDRRLIARALCTVGDDRRPDASSYAAREFDAMVEEQGVGVCTVGAYAWYQKVKSGVDPAVAFGLLPTLEDYNHGDWETAAVGEQAGLARTLASHLAYLNDESWQDCTAEERWQNCMQWVEKQIARPAPAGAPHD